MEGVGEERRMCCRRSYPVYLLKGLFICVNRFHVLCSAGEGKEDAFGEWLPSLYFKPFIYSEKNGFAASKGVFSTVFCRDTAGGIGPSLHPSDFRP